MEVAKHWSVNSSDINLEQTVLFENEEHDSQFNDLTREQMRADQNSPSFNMTRPTVNDSIPEDDVKALILEHYKYGKKEPSRATKDMEKYTESDVGLVPIHTFDKPIK